MLNVARKSMKLFFMRYPSSESGSGPRFGGPVQVIEVDLAKLFADSEAGKLKPASEYQKICGTTPSEMGAGGDMALDAGRDCFLLGNRRQGSATNLDSKGRRNRTASPLS